MPEDNKLTIEIIIAIVGIIVAIWVPVWNARPNVDIRFYAHGENLNIEMPHDFDFRIAIRNRGGTDADFVIQIIAVNATIVQTNYNPVNKSEVQLRYVLPANTQNWQDITFSIYPNETTTSFKLYYGWYKFWPPQTITGWLDYLLPGCFDINPNGPISLVYRQIGQSQYILEG